MCSVPTSQANSTCSVIIIILLLINTELVRIHPECTFYSCNKCISLYCFIILHCQNCDYGHIIIGVVSCKLVTNIYVKYFMTAVLSEDGYLTEIL